METTVAKLLRNFSSIQQAVLAGETVIIKSREGNMRLTLDVRPSASLVGCMKGSLIWAEDDIDRPTMETI